MYMHLQSSFSKLALTTAAGALATATAAGPALAAPADDPHIQRAFHGRVIARTGLLFRDAPNQGGRVVGSAPFGAILSFTCKVNGQVIDGNPRWYKLTNGKWTWASARYIVNLDGVPPFCVLGGNSQSSGGKGQGGW